ncbi:YopX family protein [Anaerococcus tetradius]|uniref:YopX family protein n=1 Tax=Anaerococcus tetradius TaxID=33036 RepID=UPI0023F5466E|nr:YopX family protein [Anaerococcus tetradius]
MRFRIWDKGINHLYYDVRVTSEDKYEKVEVLDCFSDWIGIEENNYVIMRNTGLKDKNKSEIYESDLVEYRDGEESFKGEVVINCFGSYVKTENDYIRFEDFSDENTRIAGNCYVVGNIYENPELLKEVEE